MLSFIPKVLAFLEQTKQKVTKTKYGVSKATSSFKRIKKGEDDETDDTDKKKDYLKTQLKSKAKMYFYLLLALILECIEWVIRFLISIISSSVILMLLLAIAVLVTFTSYITMMQKEEGNVEDFKPPTVGGVSLTSLAWTEEELAQYGASLSEHEKNLYRLGIYMSNAMKGYDGQKGFEFPNEYLATMFMWGVDSTETGLRFYDKGQKDLGKIPSDINGNGIGYGFLGLHTRNEGMDSLVNSSSKTLRIRSTQRDGVKAKYTPEYTVSAVNNYAPYGSVVMAAKWNNKYYDFVTSKDTKDSSNRTASQKIEAVLDEWGVQNNREYVKQFVELCIAQAQFHGAAKTEHESYAHFIVAFYCATSDNDAERSFDKWKLVGTGYAESSARKSMLGLSGGFRTVSSYGTPDKLPQDVGTIEWELNGTKIGKPLWSYLWGKYSDKSGMQKAWSTCTSWGNVSGIGDRVLNFHYGLNSYYIAKKMESELISKMGIPQTQQGSGGSSVTVTPGNYQQTPGKGQMVWDGKTTEEHLSSYNGSGKSYMTSVWQPNYGKSNGVEVGKETDKVFGVPFYAQAVQPKESYGDTSWWSGSGTFNRSGCMVYSFSYALSAMSGKLVNPPETATIMGMYGGLSSAGASVSNWPSIFKKMGFQADITVGSSNGVTYGTKYFSKIDECLNKGGVVIMRSCKAPWTTGGNHFFVITSKKDGMYTVADTTSQSRSKSLHTAEYLGKGMHRELVYVWK